MHMLNDFLSLSKAACACKHVVQTWPTLHSQLEAAQDMVSVVVRFSRCLYSMLAGQQHEPPRGWPMPLPSDPSYPASTLGLRLTAGLEMLLASTPAGAAETPPVHTDESAPAGDVLGAAETLQGDKAFGALLARLAARGYFDGEMEGSKRHRQLKEAAARSFLQNRQVSGLEAAPAARAAALLRLPVNAAAVSEVIIVIPSLHFRWSTYITTRVVPFGY